MSNIELYSPDLEARIGEAFNRKRDAELQLSSIRVVDAAILLADEHNSLLPEERENLDKAVRYITALSAQQGMEQPEIKVKYSGSSMEAGYNRIWLSRGNLQRLNWDSLEVRL